MKLYLSSLHWIYLWVLVTDVFSGCILLCSLCTYQIQFYSCFLDQNNTLFMVRYGINWWTQSDTQSNTIVVVYLNEPSMKLRPPQANASWTKIILASSQSAHKEKETIALAHPPTSNPSTFSSCSSDISFGPLPNIDMPPPGWQHNHLLVSLAPRQHPS